MAHTVDEKGKRTRTITERQLAKGEDYEVERDSLDHRKNKKAAKDVAEDALLDEIFNKKNKKKGQV